jgi:nicotinamidase/pyrazinamidase
MARPNGRYLDDDCALIIVDMQNDFCPGGALAVPNGDEIVPLVNRLAAGFPHVVLTQDWHPVGHLSFASAHPGRQPFETIELDYGTQVLWPDHCVQGTRGAEFHPALETAKAELVLRKGFRKAIDSYSAFRENDRRTTTGLAGYLRERQIRRLWLCGLATDYCVAYSAVDGREEGFETTVLLAACRAIDQAGSLGLAMRTMQESGVVLDERTEPLPAG